MNYPKISAIQFKGTVSFADTQFPVSLAATSVAIAPTPTNASSIGSAPTPTGGEVKEEIVNITISVDDKQTVLVAIRAVPHVDRGDLLYGPPPPDAYAVISANDMASLNAIVAQIRSVPGVSGTTTRMVAG